jgi:mono/diheme cytochrome c family protein
MKFISGLAALAVAGVAAFWFLTAPFTSELVRGSSALAAPGQANIENGKTLFQVGGCASCHATPGQDDRTLLGGGHALKTNFGTFHVPNISPDPQDGIGAWSEADFARAMKDGVSPSGEHYYPAFPYTSYQRMTPQDVADLFAYMKTLPAAKGKAPPHELAFPYSLRRGLGLWKLAFLDGKPLAEDPSKGPEWNRGHYLVEGPGHCAECHSPRALTGAIESGKRLAGGMDAEGKGWVPNITPAPDGLADWSAGDIAELLKTGFTPSYDSVGGSMTDVVRNTAQLSDADRAAMAAYLKSLPPVANPRPKKPAEG